MTVRLSTLDGGIRVVSHEMDHLETLSLGVWANSGSRHEMETEHGLAHFIEHMAFKGTENRTALDIAEHIEAVGGDINAATGLESTGFFVRVLKDHLDLAIEILADIVTNPVYSDDEMAREKQVIEQEISAVADTPDELVFDLFQQAAFPGQSLGRSILGTPASLAGIEPRDLEAFRSRHHTMPGLVVSAAGALDHDRLVDQVERRFSTLNRQTPPAHTKAQFASGDNRLDVPLEQVHLLLGVEGVAYVSDDMYAAQILAGILGGGMSSRLFQEAREKRGLCYAIYAFSWGFADSGLFGVYAGTDPENVSELVGLLSHELVRIGQGVAPEELDRARAQAKTSLLMSLESSTARAEQMARQVMAFGRVLDNAEIMSRIDGLGEADISALARQLFVNKKPVIGAVGPIAGLASYDQIAANFR